MSNRSAGQRGYTFVEVLAVVLILGVLVAIALPDYLGDEQDARKAARNANRAAVNSALALYQHRNGSCPTAGANFAAFLNDTTYFPDGVPVDLVVGGQTYFTSNYDAAQCRVMP